MEGKTRQRMKKLLALAERGVGGEKETAARMLQKLLKKNGIRTLEELEKEEAEYTLFSYKGKHELKLLKQCIYKIMTAADHTTYYHTKGTRQKLGIYCTRAQKIEIELEFDFYRKVFYEELSKFVSAFIQAQRIFPPDAPEGSYDKLDERDMKIAYMAEGIDRKSRVTRLEEVKSR